MVVDYQNAKTDQKVGFQDQSDPSKCSKYERPMLILWTSDLKFLLELSK